MIEVRKLQSHLLTWEFKNVYEFTHARFSFSLSLDLFVRIQIANIFGNKKLF